MLCLSQKTRGESVAEELYLLSPTAYDDAFHTLITECKGLIIPLINEMFDEHYRGDEKICFAQNEHFINQEGGGEVNCSLTAWL